MEGERTKKLKRNNKMKEKNENDFPVMKNFITKIRQM